MRVSFFLSLLLTYSIILLLYYSKHMRILFVSGSSAGHLAPLVAVEHAAKKMDPKMKTLFICSTKKSDADFLTDAGVTFQQIPAPKKNALFLYDYLRSTSKAKRILKEFKPDAIFSKGGSVSVPVCKVAKKYGIPVTEQ